MADIGGIGGFDPATTRSNFDAQATTQRRAQEQQVQEVRRAEVLETDLAARRAEETNAEQGNIQSQAQREEDSIVLSNAAEEFLVQAETDAQNAVAANENANLAFEQSEASQEAGAANQVGGVNATNQDSADEDNNAVVNGSQDGNLEQSRALGQIVDQFA